MRQPHEFPRRILALSVGLSPQVVTETVFALAVTREPPWIPTEIKVLTTAEGASRATAMLLDPQTGAFHRLCAEYGLSNDIRFAPDDIVVLGSESGAIQDIRSIPENTAAADAIVAFIRGLCAHDDTAVHVSIAGGRKTMGYYIGYALSLFGREQDRLSHVLVNQPFESLDDFFFPPVRARNVVSANNTITSTTAAQISLAEIPFVRLRAGLPTALVTGTASFSETVDAASIRFRPPRLQFNSDDQSVLAGGQRIRMPASLWAWYGLIADACKRGYGDNGMVRANELNPLDLMNWYRRAKHPLSGSVDRLEEQLRRDKGVTDEHLREKNAKVNSLLKHALDAQANPYLIQSGGRRPLTRSGLTLDPSQVELPFE
jgi:CRISPR-associated protein (TIGR02584 family)